MELDELIADCNGALGHFAKGDSEPFKALVSRADDVTLANPFGPAVRGWSNVSAALDRAAGRFRDGRVTSVERIAEYISDDLATVLDVEDWEAKVSGRSELTPWRLRVTTTFRREADDWKVVHRHADPIATESSDGPLRTS